jgi:hydroxymethylpyrimidine pyrophosphatase-like HAD family hydrolase/FixJ family two-component response regulator
MPLAGVGRTEMTKEPTAPRDVDRRLSVLIVEDSEDDALLETLALRARGYDVHWQRVADRDEMAQALRREVWDVVLCDHAMPRFDSFGALEVLVASGRDMPLIVVSGAIGEETAVALIHEGAADFVSKDHMQRLASVVSDQLRASGDRVLSLRDADRPYRLVEVMADGAFTYFRAVALDYDGTLADGPIAPDTQAALAEARAKGIGVIVVTGRIMSELRTVFPEIEDHVDAIVAEQGAVLVTPLGVRRLVAPIDQAVSAQLRDRGVVHRRGQVLIACGAADETVALDVIRGLGFDYRLVRNRGELMIVPPGVTKGSGLLEALSDVGLSPHNTIGIGDAENDHTLVDACEIAVAVNNAVDSLREHADLTLELPDGQGVAELLRGPLLAGRARLYSRRRQIALGIDHRRDAVTLPSSQLNIAICGASGEGKSYLAGLICEQLVGLGYSLVIFDPEGDYVGLGELRGVLVTGGKHSRLADPADVVRLLRLRYASVVVDVSDLDAAEQLAYGAGLHGEIEAQRAITGLPQWVVVDEAHGTFGRISPALGVFNPAAKGYLLVTWQPEELSGDVAAALDAVIAVTSPDPSTHLVDLGAAVADTPRAQIARLLHGPTGRAVLGWRARPHQATAFTPAPRRTPHLRHEHKYDHSGVEPARRFYFRDQNDTLTGAVAANLRELEAALVRCDPGVLRHHCPGHDFSHWIAGVFRDQSLATSLAAAEDRLTGHSPAAIVEQVRVALIAALQARHPS